ncbi:ethylene-insensitive protein 2.2-like [Rhododendron vialii]|uniref:ethylene-insensitive protein 2.2-like n=1 Tax=Rhododendron vialii TaxID=182163 RepID=UPI00265F45C2|nr:ethylene-insensitive protein 2.2-like [Rhododendron vialii]XP_058216377.1 ethylene-insensitive protein 2.2-like [Rhododendron vialii]XP_058216379.1 ethylene-insensitive protein 2.2-like [Rhododendron vialii]XP_058216380.1 ethylene-insensitive protein 2.2-like [Rhododendron vialii]
MDAENLKTSHLLNIGERISPAVVPVLLIAIGYVDPGKWAATVEAGARFGSDLVLLMLVFNFAAILCQYLSARIAVVTGRDLSQICSGEYDKVTCIFLGVVTELSMIALDLTMILGTAQGLNLFFGVNLCTCVLVTAFDAVLFPVFANHLDSGKVKFLCISMASFILLFYAIGVLFSQPEISMSTTGMLTKLNGESAFVLMGLLGANIMPHNFYLHSSIVQQELGALNASKGLMSHDHLFAILGVFSGIFLVNYVLMNAAANEFYSSGLVLLTFQDALQLMDQVFRSSTITFLVLLVLFVSSQITALTRNHGRQAVLHDFFRMDIPGWLNHAIIRIVAILIALCSAWNSGAEGIYQLLIVTQVAVALVVPSSVIPLFRVASSRSVMGVHKISQFVEFIALSLFFGMLCLKIIFLVEMIFGNSDWVSNLRLNVGSSMSLSYIVLLITASTSLCLMLWLAAKPLKSASSRLDAQLLNWDIKDGVPELFPYRGKTDFNETRNQSMVSMKKQETEITPENFLENYSDMSGRSTSNKSVRSTKVDVPGTLLVSDNIPHMPTIEENGPSKNCPSPVFHAEESRRTMQSIFVSTVCGEGSAGFKTESTGLVDMTVKVEGHSRTCNDAEGENRETEESSKGVTETIPSLTSEGPGSYRSISGKTDDCGSGAGSLPRLAGLGRAARRQLAAVLDEFWGQLFDFHGQATKEAKAMKLDLLLGLHSKDDDPKPATPVKVDTRVNEFTGFSSSPMSSSLFDSPNVLGVHASMETSYAVRSGSSSSLSHRMQLLDAYAQNTGHNALDSGERRYSSLRLPPSSDGNDYQPATVHGYQLASYIKAQIAKERLSGYSYGQMEALTPKSPTMGISSYIDPPGFTRARKLQYGLNSMKPPGFSKPVVSRNSPLQSERPFTDLISALPAENLNTAVNEKKYCSLPDISGLALPYKNTYSSDRLTDSHSGYGPSLYTSHSMKAGAPLSFDHLSPSKPYRDPFTLPLPSSSETGYLWSRQPGEQFGAADKTQNTGGGEVGLKQSSLPPETMSAVDLEAKLVQSFRHCIVKLLKLEGSDWLFRQNDGADEDLIDRVAARERFLCEAETREINREVLLSETVSSFERKSGSVLKNDETDFTKFLVSSVSHCGEGCVWRADLIISFGVWCIRRVLELSLLESRPELWGKYTYVLNRLQGIVDLAFSKPRMPMTPCFCLQIPVGRQQRSSTPISNGSLPPFARQGSGKCTTGAALLDIIKDVELSLSFRKGRTGTAAGDVAFPKGKENLASVLKRYKRRLSNKPVGNHEGWSGSRKGPMSVSYGL